jgi:hypothetical protein
MCDLVLSGAGVQRLPRKLMVRACSSGMVNMAGLATKLVTPASARRVIACPMSLSVPMIATSAGDLASSRSRMARYRHHVVLLPHPADAHAKFHPAAPQG